MQCIMWRKLPPFPTYSESDLYTPGFSEKHQAEKENLFPLREDLPKELSNQVYSKDLPLILTKSRGSQTTNSASTPLKSRCLQVAASLNDSTKPASPSQRGLKDAVASGAKRLSNLFPSTASEPHSQYFSQPPSATTNMHHFTVDLQSACVSIINASIERLTIESINDDFIDFINKHRFMAVNMCNTMIDDVCDVSREYENINDAEKMMKNGELKKIDDLEGNEVDDA